MASNKTAKNLIGAETEYNRYYSDFRGVDFSSESTQVNEKRLAYLVNMYRDYQSGQGEALETVPGFRKRFVAPTADGSSCSIFGIHEFDYRNEKENDKEEKYIEKEKHILIHAGKNLYVWKENLDEEVNVPVFKTVYIKENGYSDTLLEGLKKIDDVVSIRSLDGVELTVGDFSVFQKIDHENGGRVIGSTLSDLFPVTHKDKYVNVTYNKNKINKSLFSDMNERKSVSFVFNNKLYILDGKNYLVYNGESVSTAQTDSVVPIRYADMPVGENAGKVQQYQQANLLNPYGWFTFIADGVTSVYQLPIPVADVEAVKINGIEVDEWTYLPDTYQIEFDNGAPSKPVAEDIANVEILALLGQSESVLAQIPNCTIAQVYDNRVFFSGNPWYPNRIWFSAVNEPTYFGELDYEVLGVSNAAITGMMEISDSLLVLKEDTNQEHTAFFLSQVDTEYNDKPKAYSSTGGLSGIGCLGACKNFLDDAVFISYLGLEAVGQLSIKLERAKEHRSSLVDAKLTNTDLRNASLCAYGGYLWILVGNEIFLADSRQRWQNALGNAEYEWYYLNDIAVYDGQTPLYHFVSGDTSNPIGVLGGKTVWYSKTNDYLTKEQHQKIKFISENGKLPVAVYQESEKHSYTLVDTKGDYAFGNKANPTLITCVNDNVYIGFENGVVCSFNFDLRDKLLGVIPTVGYSFDNRKYISGCATLLDNCGIPHLTKSTIKRSLVVKTKAFSRSAAKIRVKTNKNPFKEIARINNSTFLFDDIDFSDFTFITNDQTIFPLKEKEKHWVEKQYYIYSDEYHSPFALHYLAFRYKVAGRIKG